MPLFFRDLAQKEDDIPIKIPPTKLCLFVQPEEQPSISTRGLEPGEQSITLLMDLSTFDEQIYAAWYHISDNIYPFSSLYDNKSCTML